MKTAFHADVYALIKELKAFDYQIKSIDLIWDVLFPDPKKNYHHLKLTQYQDTFYLFDVHGKCPSLTILLDQEVSVESSFGFSSFSRCEDPSLIWSPLINSARKWLKIVKTNWISANKVLYSSYPLRYRYGTVSSALIRDSLPNAYHIAKELGKVKTKQFVRLVEKGYFRDSEKTTQKSMTANDFFDYCKIGYLAAQTQEDPVDKKLSGKQMYERYSDPRHDGLLEIDPNSKSEFANWIDGTHPKKTSGGHPWEIKRGGNTTHIDLYVSRPHHFPKEGFEIILSGPALSRLKETLEMFLAIHKAGLPISIEDPEGIRKRLLAQDLAGIVPSFCTLHRANQDFDRQKGVSDVLYYDDLGRYKRRITPFISWDPLPILRPSSV